jgi:hypothetical protein
MLCYSFIKKHHKLLKSFCLKTGKECGVKCPMQSMTVAFSFPSGRCDSGIGIVMLKRKKNYCKEITHQQKNDEAYGYGG